MDTNDLADWLGSIGAKLFLLLFLTPFLILTTSSIFALVASQVGTTLGAFAAIAFVVGFATVLDRWIGLVRRSHTR